MFNIKLSKPRQRVTRKGKRVDLQTEQVRKVMSNADSSIILMVRG